MFPEPTATSLMSDENINNICKIQISTQKPMSPFVVKTEEKENKTDETQETFLYNGTQETQENKKPPAFNFRLPTLEPLTMSSKWEGRINFKTDPNLETVEGAEAISPAFGNIDFFAEVGSPLHRNVIEGKILGNGSFGTVRRCSVEFPQPLISERFSALKAKHGKVLNELISLFTLNPTTETWAKKTQTRNPKQKRFVARDSVTEAYYLMRLSEKSNKCLRFKKMGYVSNKKVEFYTEECMCDLKAMIPTGGLVMIDDHDEAYNRFRNWAKQISEAIHDCHTKGVKGAHLDIKPANILVRASETEDEEPTLIIADLGAKTFQPFPDNSLMVTPQAFTKSFASKEMAEHNGPIRGDLADVWMIGSTMMNCLTGRPPMGGHFEVEAALANGEKPKIPENFEADVPQDIKDFFTACFSSVENRPTADQLSHFFD
jgi:serine/threonine protein kinase